MFGERSSKFLKLAHICICVRDLCTLTPAQDSCSGQHWHPQNQGVWMGKTFSHCSFWLFLCILGVLILPQNPEKSMKSIPLDFKGLWMRQTDSKEFYGTLLQHCQLKDSKILKSGPAELWQNYISNYNFGLFCLFVS